LRRVATASTDRLTAIRPRMLYSSSIIAEEIIDTCKPRAL
jgi:hypothetical protein